MLVQLPDGRLAQIWVGGAAVGPAVFFLPGCPDSRLIARTGDDVARRAGVRLIAINRPGYGQSTPAASDHLSVADDLVALADAMSVTQFRLVGMSVGGPYALACAAVHPKRVESVAVVGASGDRRLLNGTRAEATEHFRPDFERFVASIDPTDPDDAALATRWIDAMSRADRVAMTAMSTADLAHHARESLTDARGYLADAVATFRPWAFDPSRVQCAVNLWYGDEDGYVPDGRLLNTLIPGARLTFFEATGHLAALTQHWDVILHDAPGADRPVVE